MNHTKSNTKVDKKSSLVISATNEDTHLESLSFKCFECGTRIYFDDVKISRQSAYKDLCVHYLVQHSIDLATVNWKSPKRVLD